MNLIRRSRSKRKYSILTTDNNDRGAAPSPGGGGAAAEDLACCWPHVSYVSRGGRRVCQPED